MPDIYTQVAGYTASALIILSFLFKKQTTIRTINLIGCVFFVIYGFQLNRAWPIIIPNTVIAVTQIYYLWIFPRKKSKSI